VRFGDRDIQISSRAKLLMCAVGTTMAVVAMLLSVFMRAPAEPIETTAPAPAAAVSDG
jgi:hypothetical protein